MIGFDSEFLVVPFVLSLLIYLCFRLFFRKRKCKEYFFVDITFILYCFLVINFLYFPLEIYYSSDYCFQLDKIHINLIPFINTFNIFVANTGKGLLVNSCIYIVGNLLIFVPLALFLRYRFPKNNRLNFIIILSISIFAEVFQLILILLTKNYHRVIDIDDLLLNVIGAVLTWLIFRKYQFRKSP